MADRADDKPQRTASDKERSRQMSRSVSGREAARSTAKGARQPAGGAKAPGGRSERARMQSERARGVAPPGRPPSRRPASRRPSPSPGRSRSGLFIWGAVALVIVVVVVLVIVSSTSSSTTTIYKAQPVSATVYHEITDVPTSVYDSVGTGISGAIHPPATQKGEKALEYTGKPGVFGLFGEYCPYCAAERWAIITSFSRFGTFTGLKTMQSSPADVDPKTQTFTFRTAKYTSPYFTAKLVEYFGQDKKTGTHPVIGKLTKEDATLIDKYDHSATTSSSTGRLSIPFLDFGNKTVTVGVSYTPSVLANLSRTAIASQLSNPTNDITKLIIGTSNYMSASICAMDGGKPGSVCSSAGVQAAAKALKLSS
jgi:hypothetical protein